MMSRQREIIDALGVRPEINCEKEFAQRAELLAAYLAHTGLRGFVLGISGGQDSLLAGLIAQRAVELRRQEGTEASFHAVLLPYGEQIDRADALLACETLQPDVVHDIDIKPGTDALAVSLTGGGETIGDYHKGNIKARIRMIAQYALAGQHSLLVIGTDHAAEAATGFYTKYGDGGADVLPLAGLTKRQGRQILSGLNVPTVFMTKVPTADLLDASPGQPDEAELGVAYDQIDDYLEGKPVAPAVAARIEHLYDNSWHKRHLPVTLHT